MARRRKKRSTAAVKKQWTQVRGHKRRVLRRGRKGSSKGKIKYG
jgi:hypothetical protein